MVGDWRGRYLEVGELGEEQLDGLRVGTLVDAEERIAAPAGEQLGNGLVRGDHQLLDEHVGERLALDPRPLDAAFSVERELHLPPFHAECAAGEPAVAEGSRDLLGEPQRLHDLVRGALVPGEDRLCVTVRQPLTAADEAAIEARLAGLEVGVERDLDRDAAAVLVRAQAAEVVRELVRQHRGDAAGDVHRVPPLGCSAIERCAGGHVCRDVGDVHPCPHPAAALALEREGVVEVLRLVGVDRERVEVAQVDPVRLDVQREALRHGVRPAQALVPEEPFQHGLDPARRAEDLLEPGAPASLPEDHEIADRGRAGTLAVDDDGNAALEVRLAHEELALPGQLTDEELHRYAVRRIWVSVRLAIARPSSRWVSGSSAATTDGSSPTPVMSAPAGVRYLAVVSLRAPPPTSGAIVWTERLSEGALADQRRAVVIHESAGDDLGRARAAAVDEHDERNLGLGRDSRHAIFVLFLVEAVGPADDAVLDVDRRHVHRLREEPPWIVPEIDDRPGYALVDQLEHGLLDALGGAGGEREDADVGELLVPDGEEARADRRDLDLATDDDEIERLLSPRPLEDEVDDRASVSLDERESALEREPRERLAVDSNDDVILADPRLTGRSRRRGRDDESLSTRRHGQPDAGVGSLRVLAEALVLGARQQIRVGVLETGENALRRWALEDVRRDPAVVGGGELGAYLVDQPDGPLDLHGRCGLTRSLLGTREEETQDERADDENERSEIADAPSHRTPAPGASVACTAIRFAENAAG